MSHSHKCCQKQKLRRGLWSPDEDEKLLAYIVKYGPGHWSSIPERAGIERCGKSCRLRWINYLRPDLKRGPYSESEELRIIELHKVYGNRWSKIASHLPGRTDNEIKNLWNSRLRKEAEEKNSASAILPTSGTRRAAERGAQLNENGELLAMPYRIGKTISLACSPPSPAYPFRSSQAEIAVNQHAFPLDHQNANPDQASKAAVKIKTQSQRMPYFNNGLIVHEQELCTNTLQGGFTGHLPIVATDNHAMQNSNYKLLQLQNAASYIHAAGNSLTRNTETHSFQHHSHETLLWIRHVIEDHSSDNSSSVQQFPYQHQYDLQVSNTSKSTSSTCSEDSINIPSLLENQDVTEFWFEEAFPGL